MAPVFVLLLVLGATSAAADLTSAEVDSVSGSFRSQTFLPQAADVRRGVDKLLTNGALTSVQAGQDCSAVQRASVAMGEFWDTDGL